MKNCMLFVLAAFFSSCSSRSPATIENPIARQSEAQPQLPQRARSTLVRRASAAEVDATLRRIFGGAVVVEEEEGAFVTGDFNGDGSADLAVIVHPARSKLSEINDPLSNWTVQDARRAFFSSPHDRVVFRAKASHQIVGASEQLIAVIHGYGAQGWRDRDARQAYLVRNAGRGRLQAIPAPGRVLGAPVSIKHSEVIYQDSEQPGFLFWTGSQYAWRISAKREGGV